MDGFYDQGRLLASPSCHYEGRRLSPGNDLKETYGEGSPSNRPSTSERGSSGLFVGGDRSYSLECNTGVPCNIAGNSLPVSGICQHHYAPSVSYEAGDGEGNGKLYSWMTETRRPPEQNKLQNKPSKSEFLRLFVMPLCHPNLRHTRIDLILNLLVIFVVAFL